MLDQLTLERCRELLEQPFELRLEDATLSLVLIAVEALGSGDPPQGQRRPFSLLFRGPVQPQLPQRTYPLTHGELGTLEIFLVPVGADEQGVRYEAVFA